jgi:hypothetical protein
MENTNLTDSQRDARWQHLPQGERGRIGANDDPDEQSIGLPVEIADKLADAKSAASVLFVAIDPLTGEGAREYIESRRAVEAVIAEARTWLEAHGAIEAEREDEEADDLEEKLRGITDVADEIRDEIAHKRARAAVLRNSHKGSRAGRGAPAKHRPGGQVATAHLLGVARDEDIPRVSPYDGKRLRRGLAAVALDGTRVVPGMQYRVSYNPPAGGRGL